MGTLYLVRHGQASFGAGDYDRLSDLGQRQSLCLGRHLAARGLRLDAVMRGTLRRHRETLDGVLQGLGQGHAPLEWPGLDEYDADALVAAARPHAGPATRVDTPEGRRHHFRLLRDGLARWMAGDAQPHGMPAYPDFVAGVVGALEQARALHVGGHVLAVTSGGPISVAVGHLLGLGPEATIELNLRMRNTSVTEIALTPRRLALVTFNGVPHLEAGCDPGWITHA